MGVGKEIERRMQESQMAHSRELEQKRELIEGINALYKKHEKIARDYARPFVQKLRESGAIGVLEDLRKSMDLRYYYYVLARRYNPRERKRLISAPAKLSVNSRVEIGPRVNWGEEKDDWDQYRKYQYRKYQYRKGRGSYFFSDLNLELVSGPAIEEDREDYELNFLQKYFQAISVIGAIGEDDIKVDKCYAELIWNYEEGDGFPYTSGGCQYERFQFSLSRNEQGVYMLETIAGEGSLGDSLPEQSWDINRLEQIAAMAYVDSLTHVVEKGRYEQSR